MRHLPAARRNVQPEQDSDRSIVPTNRPVTLRLMDNWPAPLSSCREGRVPSERDHFALNNSLQYQQKSSLFTLRSTAQHDRIEHMFEPLIRIAEALDVIRLDVYGSLDPAQQLAVCEQLGRLEARVKAHQLAAARAADASKAAKSVGATSTGAALAGSFGGDPSAAARLLSQAKKVKPGSATEEALAKARCPWARPS
jgi:hypothetical protein